MGLSMASKKLLGEKLTDASTFRDIAKLALAVTGSMQCWSNMLNQKSGSQKTLLKALCRPTSLVLHPGFGWVKTSSVYCGTTTGRMA